jgi:hypothetical protein
MYNLNYTPTTLGVKSWRETIIYLGESEQIRLNTTDLDYLVIGLAALEETQKRISDM